MVLTGIDNDEKFWFASDFNSMIDALQGNGIITGLVVTQRGAGVNMSVDVATGSYVANGTNVGKSSVTNVAIAASDPTNPRYDIIQASSAGAITAVTGTPASSPLVPDTSANQIRLAKIYVPANATQILNAQIFDGRIIMMKPIKYITSNTTEASTSNTTDTTLMSFTIPAGTVSNGIIVDVNGLASIGAGGGGTGSASIKVFVGPSSSETLKKTNTASNYLNTPSGNSIPKFGVGMKWVETGQTWTDAVSVLIKGITVQCPGGYGAATIYVEEAVIYGW